MTGPDFPEGFMDSTGWYAKPDLTSQKVYGQHWVVRKTRPDFPEGFMDSTVGGTHDET